MFGKKKETINEKPAFDINKIVCLTLTFNDRPILKTYKFMFNTEDIVLTVSSHLNICDNATVCMVATQINGNRYIQTCRIIERKHSRLVCEYNNFQELPERRQTVKVRCSMQCYVEAYEIDQFDAVVKNISVGGLFLETSKNLPLGIVAKINIPEIELDVAITIFRQQDDNSGYGCKFIKLTDCDITKINSKIFAVQREERKAFLRLQGLE